MLKECTFKTSSKQTQKLEQNHMDIQKAFKMSCLTINMFFPHKLMCPLTKFCYLPTNFVTSLTTNLGIFWKMLFF